VHAINRQSGLHRGSAPPVSIVVVSHNEGEKLPLTVSGIRATVPDDVEIVVVDDWSTDQSTRSLYSRDARVVQPPSRSGVAGARNWGASQARGNLLVFADAHVDPSAGWLAALRAAFADPSVACAAPTITAIGRPGSCGHGCTWAKPQLGMKWLRTGVTRAHEVPFICGCLMAFRRDDFEAIGGFDTGMVRWGSEDAEICLNLWRRGRSTVVVPQARVGHLFRPSGPYHVEPQLVVHNTLRMATVHLPELAVRRVIQAFRGLSSFPLAYAQLVDSDAWKRRESIAAQSLHDGAWFLDRFRIEALR
jgi:GT2 family glycosyltransferase